MKKPEVRVPERAQLVEESDPQHPFKKLRVVAWASNPNPGEVSNPSRGRQREEVLLS